MKLRTKMYHHVAGSSIGYLDSSDADHDAACAHALLQAKNEVLANVIYHDLRTMIDIRADVIMAGWGFDSGEVEGGR